MKASSLFLATLVMACIISGQIRTGPPPNPASADSTPSAKPGTVDGAVLNSANGEPVKKAIVTLQNMSRNFGYQALTDAAGHFHVEKVDPGAYHVMANRDGYLPSMQAANGRLANMQSVTVAEDQNVTDVVVKLTPLGAITGHVLDEDGDPISGARVQALQFFYSRGRRQLNTSSAVTSNDLGEFEFLDLQPSRYYIGVSASPRMFPPRTRMSRPEETYPTTYYPSSTDLPQATTINVTPGAEIGNVEFRLRKVPAFHIRGKVVDAAGQPPHNAQVHLENPAPDSAPASQLSFAVQQDGTFDMHAIVSGSYVVVAQHSDQGQTTFTRQAVSVADQDLNGMLLVLAPPFEVSGRITVEGPPPTQLNAQVFLEPQHIPQANFHGAVQPDGNFVVNNLSPDSYSVEVLTGSSGMYVKSIRLGERDASNGVIDLSQPSKAILNVVLGVDGGQIQGSAQTPAGDPAPNVAITVAPAEQYQFRRDLFKRTVTDPKGNFQLQDVAPGDYKVFAWETIDDDVVWNADFRKAFEGQAASVSIGPKSRESVQVKVIPAAAVEQAKNGLP
jgi:carboxypeptidase family protein